MTKNRLGRARHQLALDVSAVDVDDLDRGRLALEVMLAYGKALRLASALGPREPVRNGSHPPRNPARVEARAAVKAAMAEVETFAVHLARRDERLNAGYLP